MAVITKDDPLGLRTYDKDLAELNAGINNCLGEAESSSKAFLEAVSGGRASKAAGGGASQSKLLLNNERALVSGAIPEGPEVPKERVVQVVEQASLASKPKSKFSNGPVVATQSSSSSKVSTSTSVTVITTTTTTKKTVETIAAPVPLPPEKVVVLSSEEAKPAAANAKAFEAATPSVMLPPQDEPPSTVTEAIKTVAAFSNLAKPPSKADQEKEKVSVKALQNEFHKDRMNDAIAIREALAESATTASDTVMKDASDGEGNGEARDSDRKPKTHAPAPDLPKEPAMASPAALVQKAKAEKQLAEEAKKRAEAAKAAELAKAQEKQRKKKAKTDKEEKRSSAAAAEKEIAETRQPATLAAADVALEIEREPLAALDKPSSKEDKKHKKEKKHKKDKEKKHKKHKHNKEEKEKKKHKKHKKKEGETEAPKAVGEEEKKKKSKDKEEEKEKKKKKHKKKKPHGSETKGEDFILDDEAEEVDEPLSDEEGSLDSEEEAAENASDDEPLPDSDIEYLEESASDVDENGNIAGFVCDEVEYESGSLSEEPEEIHGRSEHDDYLKSGPRVYGKTKRLKKHAEKEQDGKRRKKDKKHRGAAEEEAKTATDSEVEKQLIEESRAAGAPIPAAALPLAVGSDASKAKKRRKNELSDDDILIEDEKPKVGKLVPSMIGKIANDLSKVVPLSKKPVTNLGAPVSKTELPMVIYKLLLSTAGFVLFTWHKAFSKDIRPSSKLPSAPQGQQVSDFNKYVSALESGKCRMADQQCCSVFRSYFGHDSSDVSAEDDESLSINALAIRVIKELARIQLLPTDVAELFYDGTARPCGTQEPVAAAAAEGEEPQVDYTLAVNYVPVLKSTTQKSTADFLDKVFFWYRPVEAIHELLERFVAREFKSTPLVLNEEGTEKRFEKAVVKSYDDIDSIISTRFAAKHRDEIHALSQRIVQARLEAVSLMSELRNTAAPESNNS